MFKTYVDNEYNRRIGRVGMPVGTMVVSRDSSGFEYITSRTYVDNPKNISLGRVGLPRGSVPESWFIGSPVDISAKWPSSVCKNEPSTGYPNSEEWSAEDSKSTDVNVYKDDPLNRRLGRVGLPLETVPVFDEETVQNVYPDNEQNRALGRVGLPLGSKLKLIPSEQPGNAYSDSKFNRLVGRVGLPLGSAPVSRCSKQTETTRQIYQHLLQQPETEIEWERWLDFDMKENQQEEACDTAVDIINRLNRVVLWQKENKKNEQPLTGRDTRESFRGTKIDFDEIHLENRIGHGGFGEVYFAEWKRTVIVVKMLKIENVSESTLNHFSADIRRFCNLNHPNIIRYLDACTLAPNVCIAMEYMQGSLHEALHIRDDTDLTERDRSSIIIQISLGLAYLHGQRIAHCNIKPSNILLDLASHQIMAKITDLGLSMMNREFESTTSCNEVDKTSETPRYAAPEVLRGEVLDSRGMMSADIYSLGLVVYEIVSEEEPFSSLDYNQLQNEVGEGQLIPENPNDVIISWKLFRQLKACWRRKQKCRPTALVFWAFVNVNGQLYEDYFEE